MTAKTIVITGASDGIGAAAARELKRQGHTVVLVGRSSQKTTAVANELSAPYYLCDFSRLNDVARLATKLTYDLPKIDVLINNAGGVFGTRTITEDGYEMTFQVNHLAPFLLTVSLIDILRASRASIITTSSVAHKVFAKFDMNNVQLDDGYTPRRAYGNSKLANILFTRELQSRYGNDITAACYHPGIIATNFANQTSSGLRVLYHTVLRRLLPSPAKGADTMVWLATTDPPTWQPGGYYIHQKLRQPSAAARDDELAARLWDYSRSAIESKLKHD